MALPPVLRDRLRLPVIGSPLFIISTPDLVIAQCKAGIVGSFPALNARPPELLDTWLTELQAGLAAFQAANPDRRVGPIAVNQIVHQSNTRLADDVAMCVKHQVPIIISSLRAPPKEMLDAIHSYGGIVLHDIITIRHAQKALEAGVDGLILVASGAGGHAGHHSCKTFANHAVSFRSIISKVFKNSKLANRGEAFRLGQGIGCQPGPIKVLLPCPASLASSASAA
eukprot:gene46179-61753_t